MLHEQFINKIKKEIKNENLFFNEPLSKYTFTKTGGNADLLITPDNYNELSNIILISNEFEIPYMVLGNGSNLIIKDGGIKGVVINLLKLNEIEVKDNLLTAQCGSKLIDSTLVALKNSLANFEFACGIPGTIGGGVFMNAGAYGGEIKDVLKSALIMNENGEILELKNKDFDFKYRNSSLSNSKSILLEATFELEFGEFNKIKEKMDHLNELREDKQPLEFPSCGSVFKRPEGLFAGKLIQDSKLQGHRIGGVEVSKKHAGFMVNINNGTATDYINLIKYVQKEVFNNFNVNLETEVKIIGEEKEEL